MILKIKLHEISIVYDLRSRKKKRKEFLNEKPAWAKQPCMKATRSNKAYEYCWLSPKCNNLQRIQASTVGSVDLDVSGSLWITRMSQIELCSCLFKPGLKPVVLLFESYRKIHISFYFLLNKVYFSYFLFVYCHSIEFFH